MDQIWTNRIFWRDTADRISISFGRHHAQPCDLI